MNFNPFIKNLFTKCIGIVRSPREEWIIIKTEEDSSFRLFAGFLLPLLLLTFVSSMIGSYSSMNDTTFDMAQVVVSGLKPFLSILSSVVISILAVNAMIRTFGGTPDLNRAAKLVIYSFVPGIIVAIIFGVAPSLYILGLFLLYSYYIFFLGTPVLLDIPTERQSKFSTLSSTTMFITYLIISFILYSFFGAIK